MGLLNDVKGTAKAEAPKVEAKKERKAAKREALKRVLSYLKEHPVDALKADIELLTKVAERTGGFAAGLTPQDLFGADMKAGSKITAVDVFVKHKKGYAEMKKYMKKWAEKGIKVELDPASQSYILR